MLRMKLGIALVALAALSAPAMAQELTKDMKKGTPDLKSAGPLAFGPDGVLFVGDPQAAAIFAIDTGDDRAAPARCKLEVEGIDEKIAAPAGHRRRTQILINDLAVNPASGNGLPVGVARPRARRHAGASSRVDGDGKLEELALDDVQFAKADAAQPPDPGEGEGQPAAPRRSPTWPSSTAACSSPACRTRSSPRTLRSIPFPFNDGRHGASVEIYPRRPRPVRDQVAGADVRGLLRSTASPTCWPPTPARRWSRFPSADLKPGAKVKGTTVAELGNRNRPLDMIVYQKGGKDYVADGQQQPRRDEDPAREHREDPGHHRADQRQGRARPTRRSRRSRASTELDRLNKENAVILVRDGGPLNLKTIPLP